MPAKSRKQQRYMGMCANNPDKARKGKECPPKAVAQEFSKNPMSGFRGNKTKLNRPSGRKR